MASHDAEEDAARILAIYRSTSTDYLRRLAGHPTTETAMMTNPQLYRLGEIVANTDPSEQFAVECIDTNPETWQAVFPARYADEGGLFPTENDAWEYIGRWFADALDR